MASKRSWTRMTFVPVVFAIIAFTAICWSVSLLARDQQTPRLERSAIAAKRTPSSGAAQTDSKRKADLPSRHVPKLFDTNSRAVAGRESVDELRKRYPFESLSHRLEYESKLRNARPQPNLSKAAEQRLKQTDQRDATGGINVRKNSLALLHSAKAQEFVKRAGFGLSRMVTPAPSYLPLPTAPNVPLAVAPTLTSDHESGDVVLLPTTENSSAANPYRMPPQNRLVGLHFGSRGNFLNSASLGYVKDRNHVAGFASHRFLGMPQLPKPRSGQRKSANTEKWLIRRLELVSLLKHARPVVYVSDTLPRLEELSDAKTRLLNEQESRGLKQLRKGNDIAIQAEPNLIRMVGSLRASKRCLECHSVQRGELLGAFSYELQRDPPIRAERQTLPSI